MRKLEYLSPSSIKTWYRSVDEFYERYLADEKGLREPQTVPMAIGSAFDAHVKAYLHERFCRPDTRYELSALFESQVESHNRDIVRPIGQRIFDEYRKQGCMAALILELTKAVGEPNFEFEIKGTVGGVPLLGKPDVFFINENGVRVVYDWKVNSYERGCSPNKGYTILRPGGSVHKSCYLGDVGGVQVNIGCGLEDVNREWADQLSIYAWLVGEEVGSQQFIAGIDQIVGPPDKMRFASFRNRVSRPYQQTLFAKAKAIWDTIDSGWIFRDMSYDESVARTSAPRTMNLE